MSSVVCLTFLLFKYRKLSLLLKAENVFSFLLRKLLEVLHFDVKKDCVVDHLLSQLLCDMKLLQLILRPDFNSSPLQTTHQKQLYFSKNIHIEYTHTCANMHDTLLTKDRKSLIRKDIYNLSTLHIALHGIHDLLPNYATLQNGQLCFWYKP